MTPLVEARHDLSPDEIDTFENCLDSHNRRATGRYDSRGLGFVIADGTGRAIGVVSGYSWAATCELKQLWVDQAHRGHGHGRTLLNAFIAEAAARGVRRIWVSSYDFQAPGLYEKTGFERVAAFADWPEGHFNIILCKTLTAT